MTKDPKTLNKAREYKRMLTYTRKALTELTRADEISGELGNRGLIDYHANSLFAKYYQNALTEVREIVGYLENELGVSNGQ